MIRTDRPTEHPGVVEVTLDRPDKRNALSFAAFEELADAAEGLLGDPSLRAVVLRGEGEAFCAGLDLANFAAMADTGTGASANGTGQVGGSNGPSPRLARLLRSGLERDPGHDGNLGQHAIGVWRQLPVPVIAAVQGHALGAGLQLALAADIRVVAPDATLSVLEIRWGLVPDLGGIPMLMPLVGPEVAAELTFTGRMVRGDEAHRIGLASLLDTDPLATARQLAVDIAAKSPDAVRQAKRLLTAAPHRPVAASLLDESQVLEHLRAGPNQVEAVKAFLEKRSAVFDDPLPFDPPPSPVR